VLGLAIWFLLNRVLRRGSFNQSLQVDYLSDSLVIMPLYRWSTITKKGLALAVQLTNGISAVSREEPSLFRF